MFGDYLHNQQILEPERYQQALAIVNEHVPGGNGPVDRRSNTWSPPSCGR
jgi:hypothetical protein